SEVSGCDATTLDGFTEAMEDRRAYFRQHGAVSSDHSHRDLGTIILDHDRAASIFDAAVAGRATVEEMALLRRHLFTDQARMAS
ncbi:glucuronate isomerase, partial [Klebsiella pneumoniae]